MRALGYGFTNEGCRQHFQGLRRAQQKADASSPTGESSRRVDPTLNPITRRPGPGRGRPKKQDENSTIQQQQQQQHQPGQAPMMQVPHYPQPAGGGGGGGQQQGQQQLGEQENHQHVAKRQKLDDPSEAAVSHPLDDEAVLALAAHGHPGPVDPYPADFSYGEA